MISRCKVLMMLACAALFALPAAATYAADRPLAEVFSYEGHGGYLYSTGNSTYSGTLYEGDRYPVVFKVDLPEDAIVKYQRYYVYWAWSRRDQQTVYPTLAVTREPVPTSPLEPVTRYVDNKGFSSPSDFYSGMDSFSGGYLSPGKNEVTLEVENAGEGNSTFVIQGIGVVVVYESASSPGGFVLVNEGCDMLYNSFGITPVMATSRVDFSREVDTDRLEKASLELVAPSGGYSRSDIIRKNVLYVNSQEKPDLPSFFTVILDLVFPNAQGNEWTDVFDSDQQQQIGIETRDITQYIAKRSNFVAVQDRGDYLLLTNAILHIEYT
jgi:hypothetical protein